MLSSAILLYIKIECVCVRLLGQRSNGVLRRHCPQHRCVYRNHLENTEAKRLLDQLGLVVSVLISVFMVCKLLPLMLFGWAAGRASGL